MENPSQTTIVILTNIHCVTKPLSRRKAHLNQGFHFLWVGTAGWVKIHLLCNHLLFQADICLCLDSVAGRGGSSAKVLRKAVEQFFPGSPGLLLLFTSRLIISQEVSLLSSNSYIPERTERLTALKKDTGTIQTSTGDPRAFP